MKKREEKTIDHAMSRNDRAKLLELGCRLIERKYKRLNAYHQKYGATNDVDAPAKSEN